MAPFRLELRRLLQLAAPVVVSQLATMMLGVVDTIMVGHVDTQTLAAASLGHVWVFGTLIFGMGVVFGIDPLVTQAHGAGDAQRQGLALQRGLLIGLAVSIPIALLWLLTDRAMLLLGQEPELARLARSYAVMQIPSLPAFMGFVALRQYLLGRGITRPGMIVAIVANVVNAAVNWILIFGHFGVEPMGIVGAGIATACTRVFLFGALLFLTLRHGHLAGGWTGWSRTALHRRGMSEVLGHGWPIGLQMGLEVWAFQTATLLAGRLGQDELAAHSIVLNIASVSFMLPLGVSMAAVTRVGNLIGAGQSHAAQRAAWVAIATGAAVMTVSAVLFILFRHQIPALYKATPAVHLLAVGVFPVAAAFQLFDGTQVVGGGVLRGMGSTRPAALFNLVGYYLFALPLAWWMTFELGWGLRGLWWGLALGLAAVAAMLVVWIHKRGPARVTPLVEPRAETP